MRHPRPECRAFTLIELLIVIAIMAILFSIGMPAIVKATQRAGEAKCLSNVRSVVQATSSYLNDFNMVFPAEAVNDLRGSNLFGQEGRWSHGVISQTPARERLLSTYLNGETSIAECPNDGGSSTRPATIGLTDFEWLGNSYNYPDRGNTAALRHLDGVWTLEGHRLTAVRQPAKKIVLADNTLWAPERFETNAWHEPIGNAPSASAGYVDGSAGIVNGKVNPVVQSTWWRYLYRGATTMTAADLELMANQDTYY